MRSIDLQKALLDPALVFDSPEAVVSEKSLTSAEKVEVLRSWEYQAAEEDIALEEGMPGNETGMMRRVLLALEEVSVDIETENSRSS